MIEYFYKGTDDKNQYGLFIYLYILTVLINYYTPGIIRISFFVAILFLFFKSKNNAFWLAFLSCLIYAPGYLFHPTDANFCLPFFGLPGLGRDISYNEIVVIVIFLKSAAQKNRIKVNNIFWILVLFSFILFIVSFLWGIAPLKIFRTIRFLVPYTLLWAIPNLLFNVVKMRVLFNYFLMFTIPVILCQLYVIFFGQHLMFLLGGSFGFRNETLNDVTFDSLSDLIRPLYSTHILLLNIFYSLYLILINKNDGKYKYAPLFLILSFLSFLITGTRGYVIASVIMILIFSIINIKKLFLNAQYVFFGFGLFMILLLSPGIGAQFRLSLERIFTVQSILEGDKTANGTLKRLTERQPKVLAKAEESLLLGFGFSDDYYKYKDGHVANATLLLNGGVIGVFVFIFFILYLFNKAYQIFLRTKRTEVLAIIIGISGFLVVHSTSYMVFSFLIGGANFLAFLLLLSFSNVILYEYDPANSIKHTEQKPVFS